MFKIIKNAIDNQNYKLEEMLERITVMYMESRITKTEKDELDNLAREKAKPENSYNLQKQLENIFVRLEALEKKTENKTEATENETEETENNTENIEETENTTEPSDTVEPTETVEPIEPVEEYHEYIQPTGAHDSYKIGDKVKFKDKNYICKMDNCVWSPETYPLAWELIEEKEDVQVPDTVEESEE